MRAATLYRNPVAHGQAHSDRTRPDAPEIICQKGRTGFKV